jgi:hypothetical protein
VIPSLPSCDWLVRRLTADGRGANRQRRRIGDLVRRAVKRVNWVDWIFAKTTVKIPRSRIAGSETAQSWMEEPFKATETRATYRPRRCGNRRLGSRACARSNALSPRRLIDPAAFGAPRRARRQAHAWSLAQRVAPDALDAVPSPHAHSHR